MANITLQGSNQQELPWGNVSRGAFKELLYQGNFGATEGVETLVVNLDTSAYRSIVFSTQATAWGVGTVVLKIYPCDAAGNANANAFFTRTITATDASPVLLFLTEMGGSVSAAAYPPTPQTTGSIVGQFGNHVKITEQMTAFTSGTNTVAVKVEMKG